MTEFRVIYFFIYGIESKNVKKTEPIVPSTKPQLFLSQFTEMSFINT